MNYLSVLIIYWFRNNPHSYRFE